MRQTSFTSGRITAAFGAIAIGLVFSLSACAPLPPPSEASRHTPSRASTASGDCASQKRRLDTMAAQGQGNTATYRSLLDSYLSRCHR